MVHEQANDRWNFLSCACWQTILHIGQLRRGRPGICDVCLISLWALSTVSVSYFSPSVALEAAQGPGEGLSNILAISLLSNYMRWPSLSSCSNTPVDSRTPCVRIGTHYLQSVLLTPSPTKEVLIHHQTSMETDSSTIPFQTNGKVYILLRNIMQIQVLFCSMCSYPKWF